MSGVQNRRAGLATIVVRCVNAGALIGLDYHPMTSRHMFADGSRRNVQVIFLLLDFLVNTDLRSQSPYLDSPSNADNSLFSCNLQEKARRAEIQRFGAIGQDS